MPYKSSKIKLTREQDGRCKLSLEQIEEIKRLYASGGHSHRTLAEIFQVSKRTIGLHVSKENMDKLKAYRKGKWRENYCKEAHRESIKKTRRKKQALYLKGELKEE